MPLSFTSTLYDGMMGDGWLLESGVWCVMCGNDGGRLHFYSLEDQIFILNYKIFMVILLSG